MAERSTRIGVRRSSYGGANIPDLDGFAARLSAPRSGDAYCTMCGEVGHRATAHAGGQACVRDCSTAGSPDEVTGPSGEALAQDRDSQRGWPDDAANVTGSQSYRRPGVIEVGTRSVR